LLVTDGKRSPSNANYDLDVRLDHATRTLAGSGTIRWRNIGDVATDTLQLHLYWNAWRDADSSWLREASLAGQTTSDVRAEDWASIDVLQLAIANRDGTAGVDLLPRFTFVQPDDGNPRDRTLAAVALPTAVAPGEEIALRVRWQAHVPRTFARTGAIGNYYFIAQWFPKVAVFEGDHWVAHQFHANTEFYSDYGRYDVRMTVPTGWVLGATGLEQRRTNNGDGTTTHHYFQDDVHDFAWTTSPSYVEHRRTFRHASLPSVQMRLLMQPEHAGQEDRHFDATAAALRYYGEWYGPYPYGHITIVDPAYQSGAGGMEYPTLFTAGTNWLAPRESNTPESVTVHEAGHQFWYGMVGNNEVEHAWMDEGLNMFSEARTLWTTDRPYYHVERFFGGFIPWQFRDIRLKRETDGNLVELYRPAAEGDDPSTPTWRYWPETHWGISYSKTALWLHTLERHLGWETLQRILSTFFQRWQFRHPHADDFFAVANEVSGRDLTWFFAQVHRSSNMFDYAIGTLTNEKDRAIVVVRRLGEAYFPVDVVTTFADGQRIIERWDGRDRWRAYTYENRGRAVSAVVDPNRILLLDIDYTNNSRTEEPRGERAAVKWSLTWMVWLQDLLLNWSFFV
jgi:Peptidase family M1 domain